jgi:hypothetical protein
MDKAMRCSAIPTVEEQLARWCAVNGFLAEDGTIMDLPPEAVCQFFRDHQRFLEEVAKRYEEVAHEMAAVTVRPIFLLP